MDEDIVRQIIELVVKAQALASRIGAPNLLQPGLVNELILARALGHKNIFSKRDSDACDPVDESIKYEYLSCKEGGTGLLDRVYSKPPERRAESLTRITRNEKIYFAVFYKNDQIRLKAICEIEPVAVANEAMRKLDRSNNDISHVGFSIPWAIVNGILVYSDKAPKQK